MGFLWSVLKSVLYGTLLIVLLLVASISYVYFFMGTTPPPESTWATTTVDTTGFTFSFVETNKVKLNVITAGPSTGKKVILLHGFPESALGTWHFHIAHFAKLGYHVIAPDQRGYNTSDKPASIDAYVVDELARDIKELAAKYTKDKFIVAGHDWGGVVAWRMAMMFPEHIEKLAILNVPHPHAFQEALRSSVTQLSMSWYIFFFQLPFIPEMKWTKDDFTFGKNGLAGMAIPGKSFSHDLVNRYIQSWSEPGALTGMINWYRAAIQRKHLLSPVDPVIPKSVPVLVLWGTRDLALSYFIAENSVNKYTKNGRLVPLDATHWVTHDLPEETAQHLVNFFEESE